MSTTAQPRRLLISAGEASGEAYGAQLMAALRRRAPDMEFFGVGGERMCQAGFDAVVEARHVAVVGLSEVLTHLPRIYGEFRKLVRELDLRRPDAAVLIDFPDFNLRLARQLHARGIPVVYYVGPQLWAWRPGRIRLVQRYVRKMLVIFPFEEQFYRRHGVEAQYVGHPLADLHAAPLEPSQFAAQYGLDPARQRIALLPGSRRKEVLMNLPPMLAAVRSLGRQYDYVLPVASTLDEKWLAAVVRDIGVPVTLTRDSLSTLAHARAAVVASGTATVEAAVMGTPFVMVYRVSPITWTLGRRLVKLDRFGMVNLIAGREVVPELIQSDCTPENVLARLRQILADGPAREAMRSGLAEVRDRLRGANAAPAADSAACEVLKVLQ